jgi:hypothetical protein
MTSSSSSRDNASAALPLPSSVGLAISEMRMPLSLESYVPLYYKSLPEMARIRADAPQANISDVVLSVVETIATLTDTPATAADAEGTPVVAEPEQIEYWARCATALILLGHGATDEAHDLVSPLSWPNELPFAYGPPVAVPEQVLTLASYVHALVHRREGPHPSEFGMTGFVNADYWAGSALRSPEGAEALPLEEIRTAILHLASTPARKASSQVQEWVQTHLAAEELAFPVWDPRVLNELCANLQVAQSNAAAHTVDTAAIQEFAEQAVLTEIKILLKHALQTIGFNVT